MPLPRGGPILPVLQNGGGSYHLHYSKRGKRRSLAWRLLLVTVSAVVITYGGFFLVYMHRANVATLEVAPTRGDLLNELVEEVNSVDRMAAAARNVVQQRQQAHSMGSWDGAAGGRVQGGGWEMGGRMRDERHAMAQAKLIARHQQRAFDAALGSPAASEQILQASPALPMAAGSMQLQGLDAQQLPHANALEGATGQLEQGAVHHHTGTQVAQGDEGALGAHTQFGRLEVVDAQRANPDVQEQAVKEAGQAARTSFGHIEAGRVNNPDSGEQQAKAGAFVEEEHVTHVTHEPGSEVTFASPETAGAVSPHSSPAGNDGASGGMSGATALTVEPAAERAASVHAPATVQVAAETDAVQLGRLDVSPVLNPDAAAQQLQVASQSAQTHAGHLDTQPVAAPKGEEGGVGSPQQAAHSTAGHLEAGRAAAGGEDGGGGSSPHTLQVPLSSPPEQQQQQQQAVLAPVLSPQQEQQQQQQEQQVSQPVQAPVIGTQQQQQQQEEVQQPAGSSPQQTDSTPQAPAASGLYALSALDIHGVQQSLSQYAGNVTLVVNVASACGYTDTFYKGLEATYRKYHSSGFMVLAFPCNQFGSQEPGSEAEIASFCSSTYQTTFPLFSKVEVNGPHTHPVFKFLKQHLPASEGGGGGTGPGEDIRWNFYKFLVDQHGRPIKRWDSVYDPVAVEREIYAALVAGTVHAATN